MLKERNNTAHIYDGEAAEKLSTLIILEDILPSDEVESTIFFALPKL